MLRYCRHMLFLLAFVLAFSLVGCGGSSDTTQKEPEKKVEKTEEKAKKAKNEEKQVSSETEADQTESASTGTDSNNQQNDISGEGTSNTASTQTNQKEVVSDNQPTTSNTQTAPSPQPKITTPVANETVPEVVAANPAPAHSQKVAITIIGPKDHSSILGATKVDIKDGDTVMDVLLKAAGNKVDYQGSGSTFYVEGIDNVYEFDYGPQSGWTYKLNGAMIQKSAGSVKVKDGDQIVWTYTEG